MRPERKEKSDTMESNKRYAKVTEFDGVPKDNGEETE